MRSASRRQPIDQFDSGQLQTTLGATSPERLETLNRQTVQHLAPVLSRIS